MPWQTRSLLEARQRFVRAALRGSLSIAQLCRDFDVSQKTGFKWLQRFRLLGGPGLLEGSRRPKHSPRRTADRWLRALRQERQRHPRWGAKKIYAILRRQHPHRRLPKVRTLAAWLQRLRLVGPRPRRARRGPQLPYQRLTVPKAANQVWTVDFKGWFRTGNGQRVDPLTVRDLFSRYILGIGLLSYQHEPVRQYFAQLFRRYGLPKIIRTDHGSPFAGEGALELSRLSAWWLLLGIRVEFTGRGRPQDNGAHEQMHRVYKADAATPPAATPCGQQRRTTRWIHDYNHQRPHEALKQRSPAVLYRPSRRRYRGVPKLIYPKTWPIRKVDSRGWIYWQGRRRMIGRAFAGHAIGFKALKPGAQEAYFQGHLIGILVDSDHGGLRPAHHARSPFPKT